MMNYTIDDDTNDYRDQYTSSKSNNTRKYLIIGIVILIILLIIIFIVKNNKSSSFSSYERKMVESAKDYISNNGINTNKEIYIDVSKLKMELPDTCNLLSGVIYDGNSYQPYLICKGYESEIVNNEEKTNFKLVGDNILLLLKGMEYYELGYTGNEKATISSINIDGEGIYNVYYVLENSDLVFTRKVIVIDNPSLNNLFPAINASVENPVKIEKGNNYNESVVAVDVIDGDITDKIIKVSNVDLNVSGEYKVIYTVQNSLGYTTTIMRKVIVTDMNDSEVSITASLSEEDITNKSVEVSISVSGNGYNYTKLPDGNTTNQKEFTYTVDENGEYEFIAVLNDETETSKVLKITNIDKTIPSGTCKASIYFNMVNVNVDIKTFNYIVGYNYVINGVKSGYISSKSYTSNLKNVTSVYVLAKDYIGNEGTIMCTTETVSNFDPNGIRSNSYQQGKSRLRIPIATALAKKGYTVNDLNMCIYNRVKEAGPYTRYGVTAAAYGLIDCVYKMTGYVLSYNHTSGKVEGSGSAMTYCAFNSDICGKLGINTRWGSPGGSCTKDECWHGLNCATFVRWAMCNGGMDLCSRGAAAAFGMADKKYFPEADGVGIKGQKVTYYSGKNLTNYSADTLVRMLQPGDVVATDAGGGHVFVVIGRDDDMIYTANDGYYTQTYKYSEMTNGKKSFRLLFLDNYYANPKNRNNLYN